MSKDHVLQILGLDTELYGDGGSTTTSTHNDTSNTNTSVTATDSIASTAKGNGMENRFRYKLLDDQFGSAHATDETYICSCLRLCGHIYRPPTTNVNDNDNTNVTDTTNPTTTTTTPTLISCVSGVRRNSVSYVRWSREAIGTPLTGSPTTFPGLTIDLLREVRLCNHPHARLGRGGWGTATDGDSTHTRFNNTNLTRLKATVNLDTYHTSALFIRKIQTNSVSEREQLLQDWLELILHRCVDSPSGGNSSSTNNSRCSICSSSGNNSSNSSSNNSSSSGNNSSGIVQDESAATHSTQSVPVPVQMAKMGSGSGSGLCDKKRKREDE